jgi:hypothetical protein
MSSTDIFQRATGDQRSIELARLAQLLRHDHARALDLVAGPGVLRSRDGVLVVSDAEPEITPDGVTSADGSYGLSDLAIDQLAERLVIPGPYLRRLHTDPGLRGLFDANTNGMLERTSGRLMLRILRGQGPGQDGTHGVVRATLSDKYRRMDHIDMLPAALEGVRRAGVSVQIEGCDLTDRRMYVRLYAPEVQVMAPQLLARYRSPFDSRPGSELPVVWAGFEILNSEVGCGAFDVKPRLMVQVCRNGMVLDLARVRRTHVGARRDDEGVVDWSRETDRAHSELLTCQVRDAVAEYLSPRFLRAQVEQLEQAATVRVAKPDDTLKTLAKEMRWSEQQRDDVLAHFIAGADLTAGGVMHAVSSLAQTVPSADAAYDLERQAIPAMRRAAVLAAA